MRPSNRTRILDAALRVADQDGVTAVTLDSVAAEAALTKSGLMYHFPSRDALLAGIEQHLADVWEQQMTDAAGKRAEEATPAERLAAYVAVAARPASTAVLGLIVEFSTRRDRTSPWREVSGRWTPTPEEAAADPATFELFLALLAADGLWSYESLQYATLGADLRARLADRIGAMLHPDRAQKSFW